MHTHTHTHTHIYSYRSDEKKQFERHLVNNLRSVMLHVDLEEVSSRQLRLRLEEEMRLNLNEYRGFLDEHMLIILGQMESPSQIFDYLYLVKMQPYMHAYMYVHVLATCVMCAVHNSYSYMYKQLWQLSRKVVNLMLECCIIFFLSFKQTNSEQTGKKETGLHWVVSGLMDNPPINLAK